MIPSSLVLPMRAEGGHLPRRERGRCIAELFDTLADIRQRDQVTLVTMPTGPADTESSV